MAITGPTSVYRSLTGTKGPGCRPALRRFCLAAGVAVTLIATGLGNAGASAADAEPIALVWNAPAACPTTRAVHDRVKRSLSESRRQFAPVAAAVTVVEVSPRHWQANLVVHSHGERAERQFEAESCKALAEAAALIIALAAEDAHDSATPAAADGVALAPGLPPEPAQPTSGWNRSGLSLLVGGLLDSGTMPEEPALGLEAAAGESWATPHWRLRLTAGASFFFPEERNGPNVYGVVQGRYWLVSLSGRACVTAALSRFEIGPCVGGELVVMRATSIGGTFAESTQYWASPLGSALAAFTITPSVVLYARTEVAFPSTRRTFLGDGNVEVYKIPAFGIRGAVGIELRFL